MNPCSIRSSICRTRASHAFSRGRFNESNVDVLSSRRTILAGGFAGSETVTLGFVHIDALSVGSRTGCLSESNFLPIFERIVMRH